MAKRTIPKIRRNTLIPPLPSKRSILPVDFKTKYLSPKFYIDLYDFAKTEKLNIKEMNIIIFLNCI